MRSPGDMADHVTFCPQANRIMDRGLEAEWRSAGYLYENLKDKEWKVGNYRILVNYNLPLRGADSREIDLVVINTFGVFLLEVKSWLGTIDAYDDNWIVQGTIKRDNAIESINSKARIFHGQMFGPQGRLSAFRDGSVTGLVVLTERLSDFHNHSSSDSRAIVRLDQDLLHTISSTDLLFRGRRSKPLSDQDIEDIYDVIHGRHQAKRDELIENYRIIKKGRDGDLFEAYDAQNVNVANQRVRVKRYTLQRLTDLAQMAETVRQFKRSVEVVSVLGNQSSHILNTINFFPDEKRPDVFFEITEMVNGQRLDEIMAKTRRVLSLDEQLDYLEPLCEALQLAHNHKEEGKKRPVYHRNVSPETIFVTQDKVVKLADFDFAKYGPDTITQPKKVLIEKPYTAPEVLEFASLATAASDIYSLGVLWYFLACLPVYDPDAQFPPEQAEEKIDRLKLVEEARSLMKKMVAEMPAYRPRRIEDVVSALKQLRAK
jgi:serine/threonine protein kinase